jgi:hypothetical protein
MALSLTAIRVQAIAQATLQQSIDAGNFTFSGAQGFTKSPATTLTTGTGANAADRIWSDMDRALSSGGTEDIDLYDLAAFDIGAGAGKDAAGQSWALVEVVCLMVYNASTSAGNLNVGGKSATTAFNSIFKSADDDAALIIHPGGWFQIFSPADPAYAVADVSNHLLKIEAPSGAVTYGVVVIGRSA